jgi:hypothetical protein
LFKKSGKLEKQMEKHVGKFSGDVNNFLNWGNKTMCR